MDHGGQQLCMALTKAVLHSKIHSAPAVLVRSGASYKLKPVDYPVSHISGERGVDVKICEKPQVRRLAWALLAGISALLLTAGLSLLLSHFQVLAQPVAEVAAANLQVQKGVNTTQARPGDTLIYTIIISNAGDTQTTAWLSDTLPTDELTYATGSLTATAGTFGIEAGEVITWSGSLTSSEVATVTFAAQIASPSGDQARFDVINTAQVTGAGTLVSDSVETTAIVTFEIRLPFITCNYPPRPDLDDIPDPDTHNSFTVSWSSIAGVDRYVLQESTDADFTTVTDEWQTTATSQLVEIGTGHGLRYYRVRADDDDRWGQGPWSEVKSVTLRMNYYDTFSDSSSGWLTHAAECCLATCDDVFGGRTNLEYKYNLYYGGGRYHTYTPKNCYEGGDHGFTRHIYPISLAPEIERPTSNTCIEIRGSFEKHIWNESWGLIFASSDDLSKNYSLWVDDRGDWAITKRTNYLFPGPNYSASGDPREYIVAPTGVHRWPANKGTTPNVLRAEISGSHIKLYVNGYEVYDDYDNGILPLKRVGIIGGNNEWGDIQIGYDYFYVDEGCDDY